MAGWQPLQSSHLSHCRYDEATQVLEIGFRDGSVYAHQGVPAELYEGLMGAESAGSYYARHIKGRYPHSEA